jgi:photosystem II stability/assembly factor-like uncharacterized protein
MNGIRIYSILIPVLLLFISSINFSQTNTEKKKLIEARLNNPSLNNFLNSNTSINNYPDFTRTEKTLNPTDYLLYAGNWPYGPSEAVAVDSINNIVYLGSGGAVLVLDVTNPANPVLLTDTIRTHGLVYDIFIDLSTNRLYLACGEGGYEIWNVENPSNPFLYSRNEIYYVDVETPVIHVQVTGNFAIFECSWGYVHSVNVSDPYNPYQVSFNGIMGNPAHNIHIDQYGYIHATGQQAYVIFYLDPSGQLYSVGELPIYNCNAVFGGSQASYVGQVDYLYIIYSGGSSSTDVGGLTHIEVRGNLAYIINTSGLHIWDVSNNDYPYLLGSIGMETYPADLQVANNLAYVSLDDYGLRIYDVSNPGNPQLVGEYDTFDKTGDTYISGDYAFISHGSQGISVIDISDLDYPVLADSIGLPGYTTDIDIRNNVAFTCGIEGGLSIINISDPENPFLISSTGNFNGSVIEVSDNYAFIVEIISTESSFIRIFDISDLNNPIEVNSMEFYQIVWSLLYQNGYLYVPAYDDGLFIYNVIDPLNPILVNNIYHPATHDVVVEGDILYLTSSTWASQNGGLHIYDISDLSSPVHLGSYASWGFFPDYIQVKDEFVYTTDGDALYLFIVDNNNPVFIERYDLPDLSSNIFAVNQYIFVGNRSAGLYVLENDLITNPVTYEWTYQQSGVTVDINDVDFLNLAKGFAAAQNGIILTTTNGGTNWETLQVGNYPDNFRCLRFADELNGWAGAETGKLFNTTDGGTTWNEKPLPSSGSVMDIDFVNSSTGWLVTLEDHYLLKTTDGGETWTYQNSNLTEPYRYFDLSFIDENTGYVAGGLTPSFPWTYFVIKTTNGGSSWSVKYTSQNYHIGDIYFTNQDTGFIGTLTGEIFKTTDGGDNWQFININTDVSLTEFCFTDDNNGWLIGSEGALYSTMDAGDSWLENDLLISNYLRGIDFVDEENGWIVGNGGIILRTGEGTVPVELTSLNASVDDGKVILTWSTATEENNRGFEIERQASSKQLPVDNQWKVIGFVEGYGTTSEKHNYTFTDNAVITGKYKYRLKQIDYNGAVEYSKEVEIEVNSLPLQFSLEQNYPNPFNPTTKIKYSIPSSAGNELVTLKVYDILGNEVTTLVNEQQTPGRYEVIFNGKNKASGVYFYQLRAGSFNSIRKFVLLK